MIGSVKSFQAERDPVLLVDHERLVEGRIEADAAGRAQGVVAKIPVPGLRARNRIGKCRGIQPRQRRVLLACELSGSIST